MTYRLLECQRCYFKGTGQRDGSGKKEVSFESSLLEGEARRFSANFARAHPVKPFKDSATPRTAVGN
jgi:hypothetical protein